MTTALDALWALTPALLFLLAAVPFADLMGRLGFFDAVADTVLNRSHEGVPVAVLWVIAALTTIVLNLDTTIVLLTPTYLRLARRSGADPLSVALIPLLLAALASSVLPVSNLTTLIAVERTDASLRDVFVALAAPSLAACAVGWWAFARRYPTRLAPLEAHERMPIDRRAQRIGSIIVVAMLLGFVVGESVGVAPWIVIALADVTLMVICRTVPWRALPMTAAIGVAAVGVAVAVVVPESLSSWVSGHDHASGAVIAALAGAATASLINNLPAALGGLADGASLSGGTWGWLLGVNAGAAFVPIASLANILWLKIVGEHGVTVPWRTYVRCVAPIAGPAFAAAVAVLAIGEVID